MKLQNEKKGLKQKNNQKAKEGPKIQRQNIIYKILQTSPIKRLEQEKILMVKLEVDKLSNKKTGRRKTNDGQPEGHKISNKKTETTETTDGQTGGDKDNNKKTGTTETPDGHTEGDKHSNKKTGTTGTTDGQTKD